MSIQHKGVLQDVMPGDAGYPAFLLFVTDARPFSVDVEILEVTSWDTEKQPLETEKYLSATVKFDGCCHVTFGDEQGYIHMCGVDSWKKHCKMMEWVYKEATKLIPDMVADEVWK